MVERKRRETAKCRITGSVTPESFVSLEERRQRIIALIELNIPLKEISTELSVPYSTVKRVAAKYHEQHNTDRKPGSGRPKLLDEGDMELIRQVVAEKP